jgi:hypothetical protein
MSYWSNEIDENGFYKVNERGLLISAIVPYLTIALFIISCLQLAVPVVWIRGAITLLIIVVIAVVILLLILFKLWRHIIEEDLQVWILGLIGIALLCAVNCAEVAYRLFLEH